eukprot:gene10841-10921_t
MSQGPIAASPPGDEAAMLAWLVDKPAVPANNDAAQNLRTTALRLLPDVAGLIPAAPAADATPDSMRPVIQAALRRVLAGHPKLRADEAALGELLVEEMIGLGPLEKLRNDPEVTDILVNRWDRIFVERAGKLTDSGVSFVDPQHLLTLVHRIVARAGRRVDQASPMVDSRLPDGSRINVILPPLALEGPALSLRRHATRNFDMQQLVAEGSVPERVAVLLAIAVRARLNIIISGGAGAGKTTLLNAMSAFIRANERVVTIEDTAELQLRQPHVVRLESRPASLEGAGAVTLRDLVRQTLRMRPDRVIVGEVRGPEAWDMITAMNTGAQGSLSTLHSNRPRDALLRLEGLISLAHPALGSFAIRNQIASAINLVIQVERLPNGARRVTEVAELTGAEDGELQVAPLYRHQVIGVAPDGTLTTQETYGAPSPDLAMIARQYGLEPMLGHVMRDAS